MTPRFCGEDTLSHFSPFYERLMAAGWFHVERRTPCALCGFSFNQEWSVTLEGPANLGVFMRVDLFTENATTPPTRRVVVSFEQI